MSSTGNVASGAVNAATIASTAPPKKDETETSDHKANSTGSSTVVSKGDTVQLSSAAQVRNLLQQGLSASQIARKLGISISKVNGYLGSNANTTTTTQPKNTTEESTETPAMKSTEAA
ncbi:MAG: hypothetical protein HQK99_07245 [Nitrospirae bacterium]|nr:hypothetical protein [Nitrospirota bacterium]